MTYYPLSAEQESWRQRAAAVADQALAPRAQETDRGGRYPRESLEALRDAGFWGLRASKEHGGQGADLLSTVLVVEELAKRCPSTAMCYKMHLEASELICRVPADDQVERFVRPLARGEVLATVAGSETWTDGDNWTSTRAFSPVTEAGDGYRIEDVRKSYVTSAGQATHFFFLCRIGKDRPLTDVSLLFIERDKVEARVLEPWAGMGLRGNDSCPVLFNGIVPKANRIGPEHTAMAENVMRFQPVLGLTYAAAYLGTGSGAFELALREGARQFADGSRRADSAVNQRRLADLSTRIEAAQTLLHAVAASFDRGDLKSLRPVLQAKVTCSETAVYVTQELMSMFGGTAFAARLPFERYFRDARAGLIMALPNDGAYDTIATSLIPAKEAATR